MIANCSDNWNHTVNTFARQIKNKGVRKTRGGLELFIQLPLCEHSGCGGIWLCFFKGNPCILLDHRCENSRRTWAWPGARCWHWWMVWKIPKVFQGKGFSSSQTVLENLIQGRSSHSLSVEYACLVHHRCHLLTSSHDTGYLGKLVSFYGEGLWGSQKWSILPKVSSTGSNEAKGGSDRSVCVTRHQSFYTSYEISL